MGRIVQHMAAMIAVVLLGGLLSAALVRLVLGFDTDEQQLDSLGVGRALGKAGSALRHQLASA